MFLTKILTAVEHPGLKGYMTGKGGRYLNNELHHLNMTFFRHQKGLAPLFVCGFGGALFVSAYIARLAMYSPEVNWSKSSQEKILNYYDNKQFKFLNPGGHDYSKMSDLRPRFE